ncbi:MULTISPECIES: hypothetical protein [unclassified Actinomyces]|uniref:hypothetical protein n=1 Tax=unclassified Actinomyces TaxID=2609248 RepID=UPI000D599F65|nr:MULTISPECIES: hypothetical protein [unclassified Actinomyces]RAX22806.1 hypothetical protein DRB07_06655 [Actinomyces sp. Z3]
MTRLSRRTALTTAFAGVLAASLAACSDSEDTQNTGAASQEAGETTAAADADGGSDSTATVPDGYTAVEIPDTTVAFAVPSDWNVLTSDDADDDERINAFIQSTGLDEDTVRLKLEAYSVFAASGADSDATEELDVQTDSRTTELRSEEEISADMEEYGLTPDDLSVSTATTGSGAEARLMSYSLEVVEPQYTSMVNALNPDGSGIIVFTVTSTDSAERAQELVDAILGSI